MLGEGKAPARYARRNLNYLNYARRKEKTPVRCAHEI